MSDIVITVMTGSATVKIEVPSGADGGGQNNIIKIGDTKHPGGIVFDHQPVNLAAERAGEKRRNARPVHRAGYTGNGAERKTVVAGPLACFDDNEPNDAGHMYVGERIRVQLVRRVDELTYAEVADAGIDRRDFGYMLNNQRRTSATTRRKLAALFGVPIEEFLGDIIKEFLGGETKSSTGITMVAHPVAAEPHESVTTTTDDIDVAFAEPAHEPYDTPESPVEPAPAAETPDIRRKRGPYGAMVDISAQLTAWLAARNINQSDLSRMSGVHNGEISKFRRGIAKTGMVVVKRLADGLGVPVEAFLAGPPKPGGDNAPKPSVPPAPTEMTILEQWMEAKGKSVQDIANASGMDVSMVRMMARGEREIGMNMTAKLAKIFRIPPQRFHEGPKEDDFHNPAFNAPAIGRIESGPLAGKGNAA